MKASIAAQLNRLVERHEELTRLMADPEVAGDGDRLRKLSREYSQLDDTVTTWQRYQAAEKTMAEARDLLKDSQGEMAELAEAEIAEAQATRDQLEQRLRLALLPVDPRDEADIFLEIRAGTGGDEAALFAGDLFRMYGRYADAQGWRVQTLSASEGEHGGFKEVIARIEGDAAFSKLKFESGAHRVQRVPETESQGRIHTSACTVAVLAEREEVDEIRIDPSELRIDTFRSSGAGGQHVNTTDSAIRITHLPTGTVVECQDERSQHKNKARALSLLKARIEEEERAKQEAEQAETRKSLVGSGDRSERIRTYNFPQGRVTDHRINLTLYKLDDVLEGALAEIVEPLIAEHQARLLVEATGG